MNRFFQMGETGQDETVHPQLVILLDPFRYPRITAHQRGAGAAAYQAHTCPQVG